MRRVEKASLIQTRSGDRKLPVLCDIFRKRIVQDFKDGGIRDECGYFSVPSPQELLLEDSFEEMLMDFSCFMGNWSCNEKSRRQLNTHGAQKENSGQIYKFEGH